MGLQRFRSPDQSEADTLWAETTAFVDRYQDLSVAAADGYRVEGVAGNDFHAGNPEYQNDGLMLDPTKPENLIYGMGTRWASLLGVMFEDRRSQKRPPLDWWRRPRLASA